MREITFFFLKKKKRFVRMWRTLDQDGIHRIIMLIWNNQDNQGEKEKNKGRLKRPS